MVIDVIVAEPPTALPAQFEDERLVTALEATQYDLATPGPPHQVLNNVRGRIRVIEVTEVCGAHVAWSEILHTASLKVTPQATRDIV